MHYRTIIKCMDLKQRDTRSFVQPLIKSTIIEKTNHYYQDYCYQFKNIKIMYKTKLLQNNFKKCRKLQNKLATFLGLETIQKQTVYMSKRVYSDRNPSLRTIRLFQHGFAIISLALHKSL